jgi:hypothetical protein
MSSGFKLIKSATWEEFISVFFMFGKLGFLVLFLLSDGKLCVFYFILVMILWLILKMPKYTGPSKLLTNFKSQESLYEEIGYDQDDLIVGLKAEQHFKDIRKKKKTIKEKHQEKHLA